MFRASIGPVDSFRISGQKFSLEQLRFLAFPMEPTEYHVKPKTSWLNIRMTKKKIISRYCGDGMPERLTSSKDTVLVHFQSDYSVAHNGFRLGKIVLILIK